MFDHISAPLIEQRAKIGLKWGLLQKRREETAAKHIAC